MGAFAFIFGNFALLSTIIFDSFATLGLNASAASFSPADLLKPGLVAAEGLAASQPIFDHIGTIAPGPFEFFGNLAEVILLCLRIRFNIRPTRLGAPFPSKPGNA